MLRHQVAHLEQESRLPDSRFATKQYNRTGHDSPAQDPIELFQRQTHSPVFDTLDRAKRNRRQAEIDQPAGAISTRALVGRSSRPESSRRHNPGIGHTQLGYCPPHCWQTYLVWALGISSPLRRC